MAEEPPVETPAPPDSDANGYYRHVAGTVSACVVKAAPSVRLEVLTRLSQEPITWRFRQPGISLFWWQKGFRRYSIELDGDARAVDTLQRSSFTLVPPDLDAQGEFHADRTCHYQVAFIDLSFLQDRGQFTLDRPMIGFVDAGLERSLGDLAQWRDDATFGLMAEGWALQAMARLRRGMGAVPESAAPRTGLSGRSLRMLEEYVFSRLHEPIGLIEMAGLVGLSVRHFARAFRASTGQTPARFVHERRILRAKQLLDSPAMTITDVAFACGFSHAQHFTTSFRRETGMTPSAFRRERNHDSDPDPVE
jgi:AraC family transcriptional regulator